MNRKQIEHAVNQLGCMRMVAGKGWTLTEKGIQWASDSTVQVAIPDENLASDIRTIHD